MDNTFNPIHYISFLLFSVFTLISFGQESTIIASCCNSNEAKCTGSSSCRACTNCSRCGYCSGGGFCGVCARPTSKKTATNSYYKSYSENKSNKPTQKFSLSDEVNSANYLKSLVLTTRTLNLRNGPTTSYSVLEKIHQDQKLIYLALTGEWIKVKVKSTGTIGFVNYKYVSILNKK